MLEIEKLKVSVENKIILNDFSLKIKPGEVHAVMGKNGAGKSSLAQAIIGNSNYSINSGKIKFNGSLINDLEINERALLGIFLAFQYPIEIPGVNNTYLLRSALNAKLKSEGKDEIDSFDFLKLIKSLMNKMNISDEFIHRSVNEGFSGGEKKKNEVLQMLLLEPKLCILDETDSGLDVDALKIVSNGVNELRDSERSFLIITHYKRLLELIKPDFVHVIANGSIVKTGNATLADELDKKGFDWI
jgi:Fe-S cluster assembly ATP-binding protein